MNKKFFIWFIVAIFILLCGCQKTIQIIDIEKEQLFFTDKDKVEVEKDKQIKLFKRTNDITVIFFDKKTREVVNFLQTERKITIRAEITAYCACKRCNGKYSIDGHSTKTATPLILRNEPEYADKYCAATAAVGDFGDIVIIDGIGYEIVDRMGRKEGKAIDIFVPDHQKGNDEYERRRNYEVEVIRR